MIVWPEELQSAKENEAALREKYAKFNEEVNLQDARVQEALKLAEVLIQSGHPDELTVMRRREVLYAFNKTCS